MGTILISIICEIGLIRFKCVECGVDQSNQLRLRIYTLYVVFLHKKIVTGKHCASKFQNVLKSSVMDLHIHNELKVDVSFTETEAK